MPFTSRLGPCPGDQSAVEGDVAVDDDGEGQFLVNSPAGRVAEPAGLATGFRSVPGGSSTRPRRSARRRAGRSTVLDEVRVPGDPGTAQGRAVAIASRSELLMPSATLGRTKRSTARRYSAGSSTAAGELDPVGDPQRRGQLGECWRSLPGPTRIRLAGDRRATSVQASSRSGMFFWGWSRPVKIARGRGSSDLDGAKSRRGTLGINAAGHPDDPPGATPRSRHCRSISARSPRTRYWPGWRGGAARALACGAARRPRRRTPRWPAAPGSAGPRRSGTRQARRHGLPEPLMGMDDVDLRA